MLGLSLSLDSRPMHLALHAIALLGLSSLALSAVATPVPLPLPLMTADYTLRLVSANRSTSLITPRRIYTLSAMPTIYSSKRSRQPGSPNSARSLDPLEDLARYSDAASQNAGTLNNLAANSANIDNDDLDFQQEYTSRLSDFNANVQGFHEALAKATSDKGLAYYDKQNDLEKLLKEIVNAHKDVLSAIDIAVENIPGLGPILGPVIYQTKCLIDLILDVTEDLSDAIINALGPLLQGILGKATADVCRFGVEILGLCV
ncbi:hypothetical protein CPB84DRAFT_1799908 [Gymnopilus junonius]|uniref:Uncharacterized protein n=1 Tax=Gymnopilus junonius TaxID=109634 RepID=A0A9P5N7R0_GYMJU|nr:hypothetical protein CPB84DRAFT_1799908 [Gymnopilus junonius]